MPVNFVQALSQMKRKAALSGRPISKQEVAGLAEGYADTASERIARSKSLGLQERSIESTEKMHAERLAEEKRQYERTRLDERKTAREQRDRERQAGFGTVAGGIVGGIVGGPIGALIGGGIGGKLFGGCIIITACTHPYSPEVMLAREYRDEYLGPITLRGYYRLSKFVVPLLSNRRLKWLTKRVLVDRLVDYGQFLLGYRDTFRYKTSRLVKTIFLKTCYVIGRL